MVSFADLEVITSPDPRKLPPLYCHNLLYEMGNYYTLAYSIHIFMLNFYKKNITLLFYDSDSWVSDPDPGVLVADPSPVFQIMIGSGFQNLVGSAV